jgi:hypothetical protein
MLQFAQKTVKQDAIKDSFASKKKQNYGAKNDTGLSGKFPFIERKAGCACGGGCSGCQKSAADSGAKEGRIIAQAKLNAAQSSANSKSAFKTIKDVSNQSGQPLEAKTRAFMESSFDHDFSDVVVHTDTKSAESARAANAVAYTTGNHIVFDNNEYNPETEGGRKLLAHELTHVVQQSRGGSVPPSLLHSNSLEKEADAASSAILSGSSFHVGGSSLPGLARQPRSLSETVVPSSLSDESLANEMRLIQEWLTENPASSEERTILTSALMSMMQEGIRRRPQESAAVVNQSSAPTSSADGPALGLLAPMAGRTVAGQTLATAAPEALAAGETTALTTEALAVGAETAVAETAVAETVVAGGARTAAAEGAASLGLGEILGIGAGTLGLILLMPFMLESDSPRPHTETETQPQTQPRTETQTQTDTEAERRKRNSCFEQFPNALACDEPPIDMEEAVVDYIMNEGHDFSDLGNCTQVGDFGPGEIDSCNGAPGQRWHCSVSGSNLPVSIFACLCCNADGSTGFRWEGPHWSVNQSRRGK